MSVCSDVQSGVRGKHLINKNVKNQMRPPKNHNMNSEFDNKMRQQRKLDKERIKNLVKKDPKIDKNEV